MNYGPFDQPLGLGLEFHAFALLPLALELLLLMLLRLAHRLPLPDGVTELRLPSLSRLRLLARRARHHRVECLRRRERQSGTSRQQRGGLD